MTQLMGPGHPVWEREKDPRVRFRLLSEAIAAESPPNVPLPDFNRLEQLYAAREAYRAACLKVLGESEWRPWDAANNLSVSVDAVGRAKRYQRRQIQRYIAKWIDDRRHRKIWAVIWKSRQQGVTTEIAVQIYQGVTRGHGQRALITAQSDPDSAIIFEEKYKLLHANDPLAPKAARSNTTELLFPEITGHIRVRTAGGRRSAGRGGNVRYAHFSEAAWYEGNPYGFIGGILGGMTHPQSMAFLESTGNGQSGFFYEKAIESWNAEVARREGREPEVATQWEPIFLPFYLDDEAKAGVPFKDEEEREKFKKSMRDDEKLIQQEHQLADEVMHWYRMIYDTKAQGETEDAKLMWCLQEFPATVFDSFQAPGSCAFNAPKLVSQSLVAKKPIWVGDIASPGEKAGVTPMFDFKRGEFLSVTPRPILLKGIGDRLRIWQQPREGRRYWMGTDVSESGHAKSDFTETYIMDMDSEDLVAHYQMKSPDPLDSMAHIRLLSKYYNDAMMCIEANRAKTLIYLLAKTDREKFLFVRQSSKENSGMTRFSKDYGFETRPNTKPVLVDLCREKHATQPKLFIDKHLLDQMKTFTQVRTEAGTWTYPGAKPGSGDHDDGVMAFMLMLIGARDMPHKMKAPAAEAPTLYDSRGRPLVKVPVADRMKGHLEYEQSQRDAGGDGWG